MSEITIDSEKIAEIRNALQVIQLNVQTLDGHPFHKLQTIEAQVKRIDGLLPPVKFEGGK